MHSVHVVKNRVARFPEVSKSVLTTLRLDQNSENIMEKLAVVPKSFLDVR